MCNVRNCGKIHPSTTQEKINARHPSSSSLRRDSGRSFRLLLPLGDEAVNHPEADYIRAGFKYESATSLDRSRAEAQRIRAMLSSETPNDQTEARRLIEQGRKEARK
jgi:hypothetical protein